MIIPNIRIHPIDRLRMFVIRLFSKIRVDLCLGENDGFDVGAFCVNWKRSFGPFLLHRQMENGWDDSGGPWRLMIAFSSKAYVGFDDAIGK